MTSSRPLNGLTLQELSEKLQSRSRALEALKWLYAQEVVPAELPPEVPGVSQRLWRAFRAQHGVCAPDAVERHPSADGTTKYALTFGGVQVEMVRIPARDRTTVCLSSQAGCTRRCVFCATKELGFLRNLKAEEMLAQYQLARAEAPAAQPARNVVFMGMGEPLDNLDEVLRAVELLTQGPAPQLRAVSVTVSTSGIAPAMARFLKESKASLALSLNATTDEVRSRVMPHNATWPIATLLEVLREGAAQAPDRNTFVEYVLFDQVNDTEADADRLVALLRGLPARVNLIPWNPTVGVGAGLATSPAHRVAAFHQRVMAQGQLCLVREPRGQDIAGACGQLVNAPSARA